MKIIPGTPSSAYDAMTVGESVFGHAVAAAATDPSAALKAVTVASLLRRYNSPFAGSYVMLVPSAAGIGADPLAVPSELKARIACAVSSSTKYRWSFGSNAA